VADVKWIAGAPFFQFHTMNAFAEGNRIEVVVPWYDSFSLTARSSTLALHRLVIPAAAGAGRPPWLLDTGLSRDCRSHHALAALELRLSLITREICPGVKLVLRAKGSQSSGAVSDSAAA